MKIVAILSTTILPTDGIYRRQEIPFDDATLEAIKDTPHYVGHPATQELLNNLGAIFIQGKFSELKVGESFLAVPLANNQRGTDAAPQGTTYNAAIEGLKDLKAVLVTRLPDENPDEFKVSRVFLERAAGSQAEAVKYSGMDIGDYILDSYAETILKRDIVRAAKLEVLMSTRKGKVNFRGGSDASREVYISDKGYMTIDEALAYLEEITSSN